MEALTFLKSHNPYYPDIIIDNQQLSQLPLNDCDQLTTLDPPNLGDDSDHPNNHVYESITSDNISA